MSRRRDEAVPTAEDPVVVPPAPSLSKKAKPLRYALWAHNMGYVTGVAFIVLGIFGMLWKRSGTYGCRVGGAAISSNLIKVGVVVDGKPGTCISRPACCDPNGRSGSPRDLGGSLWIGGYCFIAGFVLLGMEWKFLRLGWVYIAASALPLMTRATCAAAAFGIATGATFAYSRHEKGELPPFTWGSSSSSSLACAWTPASFWTLLYLAANAAIFLRTLVVWVDAIRDWESDLKNDNVKFNCRECPDPYNKPYSRWRDECDLNKALVKHGPLSYWAPVAKAAGVALNFNCALLIVPVTKSVLIFLNQLDYRNAQKRHAWFAKLFRSPLARYLPLSKNVEFHKMIAFVTCFLAIVHTLAHLFNYWQAPIFTEVRFAKWGWAGTTFVTGGAAALAMFLIYTSAMERVKNAKFEIFWFAHHFLYLFYAALLLHGPVFYWWALAPVLVYLLEKASRVLRRNRAFLLSRCEWIDPVLAIHFRPLDKQDFDFQEGTYVLINCPYVSEHEWHPFTISSARGDLTTGPRISLETGEECTAVPPPPGGGSKGQKFCPLSKDPSDRTNLVDSSETCYHDFVSVHVKVFKGSWTTRLKDYLETMAPSQSYPFHFTRRDDRGDVLLGRRAGPDGRPILKVDGPYAAPAVHYKHYGTIMLVGAGIGMTPCASILTAMLKYRWRLNFKPEILHFYWVCTYQDIKAFEWFVRLVADLEHELHKGRQSGAIAGRNYCEINVYVTRTPAEHPESLDTTMHSDPKLVFPRKAVPDPTFAAEDLWTELMWPKVSSAKQFAPGGRAADAPNRFQDTFVWNGRPEWNAIFSDVKTQRQHRDIGVFFCGAKPIGAELEKMCTKYSAAKDDCVFTLHKENF